MPKIPIIFLAFANDKQTAQGYLRNLTQERNTIGDALKKATVGENPVIEVVVEPDVSIDKIFSTFQDERYRDRIAVFHYGGHADDYMLLLENAKGEKTQAHAGGLIPFLAHQDGLQLIFLNGCSTQQQAVDLVDAGVPAVIGTSSAIPDKMAQIVAEWFYRGLGAGLSVERAWREADQRVRTEHDEDIHRTILGDPGLKNGLPWDIRYAKSSKLVKEWNMPDAAQNPVFGLPEIDTRYYLTLPPSPFLGLRRFESQHAGIFFGRNSEIRKLIDKINGIYPVILYYGLSGVGKSSLLEAGLIPRIEKSYTVKVMRRNRDVGLLGTLKTGLKEMIASANASAFNAETTDSILSYWQLLEKVNGKPLLFILDQAEETYTKPMQGEQDEWDTFCHDIKPLVNHLGQSGSGKLVLSFRAEYLPQIQNALYNNTIPKTDLLLLPLNKTGIKEAILGITKNEHTADQYKLTKDSIEEELAEEIAYDLSADKNSPVAPILQIVLSKLWERAAFSKFGQRDINTDLYHQIRDEGIALSDFVSERFTELQNLNVDRTSVFFNKDVERSGLVVDILMQFVTSRNTADAFEAERIKALYPHRNNILLPLLDHLVDARILTTFSEDHKSMIGLSHDTLAPVVREFYESSDLPGQRARRILEGKLLFEHKGKVLDELDLTQVENGVEGMLAWTDKEQQLVTYSRTERQKRIRQKKLRKVFMLVSVGIIFLFGIGALLLWYKANQNAIKAHANGLASKAQIAFAYDRTLAVNLALEAMELSINKETGLALSSVTGDAGLFYKASFQGDLSTIRSVSFSNDGKKVFAIDKDSTFKVWSLEGFETESFLIKKGNMDAAFSPDGKYVLIVNSNVLGGFVTSSATLWGTDGSVVDSFKLHNAMSVASSPDFKYVLIGSLDTAQLWSLDGKLLNSFVGHKGWVVDVAFSPDGNLLVTGGEDGKVNLWRMDGSLMTSFVADKGVSAVAFSPDGQNLATGGASDGKVRLWDLHGNLVRTCFWGCGGGPLAFSPDGSHLISGCGNVMMLWKHNEPYPNLFSFAWGHQDAISSLSFSADGKNIISGSQDGAVKLWGLGGIDELLFVPHKKLRSIACSPDGKYLIGSSDDSTAMLFTMDGSVVDSFIGHKDIIRSISFSPDGKYVLTGSRDSTAILWNLNGEQDVSFVGHHGRVNSVAFSPDGKYVLTGSGDSTATLWNLDGSRKVSFVGHKGRIASVAFSPDGNRILTGSTDRTAKLWDMEGKVVVDFLGHEGDVLSVAFSPDGKSVITGSRVGTAKLWNLEGDEMVSLLGQDKGVYDVAFSPDGKYILTNGQGERAKLWNLKGIEVQSFGQGLGQEGNDQPAIFSPDGQHLIVLDFFGNVKKWTRWDYLWEKGILVPLNEEQKREYGIE